jgi:DNA invertase Pin-like site-specific DNA recombinase
MSGASSGVPDSIGGAYASASPRKAKRTTQAGTASGYIRYSTEKQGENSAGRQAEAIERWAARTGVTLLGFFFDFAVSRATAHGERPGLVGALDELQQRPAGALVAETVSRWAFDGAILEAIRIALRDRKSRLATADESGDADLDEDHQDFQALFSKHEVKAIRKRTKGALAVKRMRGERVGAVPFGQQLAHDGAHRIHKVTGTRVCAPFCPGCLHLTEHPTEAATIRRAKALSEEGLSIRAIAERLAAEGHVGRTGAPLSHTQVHRFLRPLLAA